VPAPGEIVKTTETWVEPAGGGAVAAVQLARLAGTCLFLTALGDDELGHRARDELTALGVRVEATFRPEPQRRGFVFLDSRGERTITVIGEKKHPALADPLPWDELPAVDGVYVTAGDPAAVRAARAAKVVVGTARELELLQAAAVELDAVVSSSKDAGEVFRAGDLDPPPRLIVRTAGSAGGSYEPGGKAWAAAPLPGPLADAYGAGDSFAAGLTYGLGAGLPVEEALALASRCGAEAMTRRGAHGVAA
jgi:ribokinase